MKDNIEVNIPFINDIETRYHYILSVCFSDIPMVEIPITTNLNWSNINEFKLYKSVCTVSTKYWNNRKPLLMRRCVHNEIVLETLIKL